MKIYCLCALLWASIGEMLVDAEKDSLGAIQKTIEVLKLEDVALHEKVESIKRRQADPKSQADVEGAVKKMVLDEMKKFQAAHKTSYCQLGVRGANGPGYKDGDGDGAKTTRQTVTFAEAFHSKPRVIVAIQGLHNYKAGMNINSAFPGVEKVTTTSFVIPSFLPYHVSWVRYSWVACA